MDRILTRIIKSTISSLLALASIAVVQAQWQTQSVVLKPGWNGVYLHVDMQHTTMTELFASTPVTEVWLWKPDFSTLMFVTSPQAPLDTNSRWLSWKKAFPLDATIDSPIGNAAYLIRLDESEASDYTLNLKGQPVPPTYNWSSDGSNFIGFSTVPTGAPSLFDFLEPAPDLRFGAEVFGYDGGPISENPKQVFDLRSTDAERGTAFWIRSEDVYNRYYSPFALDLQSQSGVGFGEQGSTYGIRLSNNTAEELTVTMEDIASETAPAGQTTVVGTPELLVRGTLDPETLTHSYSRLSEENSSWVLAPKGEEGSAVSIVLGLDRSEMSGSSGDLYASLLRFTDSVGYAQYDLPVSATKGDFSGLWVGEALVTQVRHNLSYYDRTTDDAVLTGTDTSFGGVPRGFKLRVIMHVGADGTAKLLQRVYSGIDDSLDPVLTTLEGNLDSDSFDLARRISAPNLPWTEGNLPWVLSGGSFDLGNTLTTTVDLGADDQRSNPFLHTYHPDHDNRNATFDGAAPAGTESFSVSRALSFSFSGASDDFTALTAGSVEMGGSYSETITLTGEDAKSYEVQGTFLLTRLSDNDTLLTTLSE
ncbi:hypothetical protein VDG1235_2648 [Verrucomicrobiia bacterium DG1235]|nr:hypothetical protein VDG1235_2648 [Verrucomicrobiae bacterium DG1235]